MCGIAGWAASQEFEDASPLRAVIDRLRHRGPDDAGEFIDAKHRVALAHRRLSIIDLSAASHEPMVDEATGVAMVYNGELYNFVALRGELTACGHVFRSRG